MVPHTTNSDYGASFLSAWAPHTVSKVAAISATRARGVEAAAGAVTGSSGFSIKTASTPSGGS